MDTLTVATAGCPNPHGVVSLSSARANKGDPLPVASAVAVLYIASQFKRAEPSYDSALSYEKLSFPSEAPDIGLHSLPVQTHNSGSPLGVFVPSSVRTSPVVEPAMPDRS